MKKRLDQLVLERYPDLSRTVCQSLIVQGKVSVDGRIVTKAGTLFSQDVQILTDTRTLAYVSRAGHKLAHALDVFAISVSGLVVLDAGISTGGFTDCLLQRGAARVYGVDVAYGLIHEKIRTDPRVMLIERTNIRYPLHLPEQVDLVCLDLSFISVLKVLDTVCTLLKPDGKLLVLIKPQFEAGKQQVGPGGIITDPAVHQEAIDRVTSGIQEYGFTCKGVVPSPITGGSGNQEFLAYFVRHAVIT